METNDCESAQTIARKTVEPTVTSLRKNLTASGKSGAFFSILTKGPARFELNALALSGEQLLKHVVAGDGNQLAIRLPELKKGKEYTFLWAVFSYTTILKMGAFVVYNGQVTQLAEKKKQKKGAFWISKEHKYRA